LRKPARDEGAAVRPAHPGQDFGLIRFFADVYQDADACAARACYPAGEVRNLGRGEALHAPVAMSIRLPYLEAE
jgi:hypothetical protein